LGPLDSELAKKRAVAAPDAGPKERILISLTLPVVELEPGFGDAAASGWSGTKWPVSSAVTTACFPVNATENLFPAASNKMS
jgi:hypothetical protein